MRDIMFATFLLFLYGFNVQCRPVLFIYITVCVGVWGQNYLLEDFGLFNFIQCLWTSFLLVHNGIFYHYY